MFLYSLFHSLVLLASISHFLSMEFNSQLEFKMCKEFRPINTFLKYVAFYKGRNPTNFLLWGINKNTSLDVKSSTCKHEVTYKVIPALGSSSCPLFRMERPLCRSARLCLVCESKWASMRSRTKAVCLLVGDSPRWTAPGPSTFTCDFLHIRKQLTLKGMAEL